MFEETEEFYAYAAENIEKAAKSALGEDYTVEEFLRFQMKEGLITPKSTEEYNIKNEFLQIKEGQVYLPEKDQLSDRQINDHIAATTNSSMSRVYGITRDL